MAKERIYHPELKQAIEVAPSTARVLAASGWRPAEGLEPPPEPPEPPPSDARKAEWIDYAVELGVPRDEAEALTKAELQDL